MFGQRIARLGCLQLLALVACDRSAPAPSDAGPATPVAATSSVPPSVPDASAPPDVVVAVDAAPAPVDATVDAAVVAAPLPAVRVANIGMHIGGGPNDDVTKAPIAQSVAPHFDAFRACFSLVDPPMKVELGVDLLIEAAGGKAKVTNPRSTAPGTQLRDCGVKVFESVDFLPPKTGKTMVSYSLQFSPQKP